MAAKLQSNLRVNSLFVETNPCIETKNGLTSQPKYRLSSPFSRACVLALTFAALFGAGCTPAVNSSHEFERQSIELARFGLFDLGVVDFNGDSALDIFTVNHSATQSVLTNQGNGEFSESFATLGIDQDSIFPGLAVSRTAPAMSKPGLYVYWLGPTLQLHAHKLDAAQTISGTIELWSKVKLLDTEQAKVTINETNTVPALTHSTLGFSIQGGGNFSFKPVLHAMPIKFALDTNLPLDSIYVGPGFVSPPDLKFSINMRDRHGMAWSDFDNDGVMDVFITRGGQRGMMRRMPDSFWDELFVKRASGFVDIGKERGLEKKGCSGRQTNWIDFNGDGLLDLYVSCGRRRDYQPNKLYKQLPDGKFTEVAKSVGLDIGLNGSFVWLDVNADAAMDLFWVDQSGYYLFRNEAGHFTRSFLGHTAHGRDVDNLSVADFDNDGDLDIFSAAKSGNVLCINTGGDFVLVDPTAWGLPRKSLTANWVDHDNNGLQDLHAVPDGLYAQNTAGVFKHQLQLNVAASKFSPTKVSSARANWFDFDNNGTRDLVLALSYARKGTRWAKWLAVVTGDSGRAAGPLASWQVSLFKNKNHTNHWINIDLVGPPGNRPAIGTRVTVLTRESKQVQQIGGSDGAHFSQGHYRLYFGLGQNTHPESIQIAWPDGMSQTIEKPTADRLLKVVWQPAK